MAIYCQLGYPIFRHAHIFLEEQADEVALERPKSQIFTEQSYALVDIYRWPFLLKQAVLVHHCWFLILSSNGSQAFSVAWTTQMGTWKILLWCNIKSCWFCGSMAPSLGSVGVESFLGCCCQRKRLRPELCARCRLNANTSALSIYWVRDGTSTMTTSNYQPSLPTSQTSLSFPSTQQCNCHESIMNLELWTQVRANQQVVKESVDVKRGEKDIGFDQLLHVRITKPQEPNMPNRHGQQPHGHNHQ